MKKIIFSTIGVAAVIVSVIIFQHVQVSSPIKTGESEYDSAEWIDITNDANFIFKAYAKNDAYKITNGVKTWDVVKLELDPSKSDMYREIGNMDNSQNAVVIIPVFTASAYNEPGFYTYYRGECDESCLTIKMAEKFTWNSSVYAIQVFNLLGYKMLTDIDVHENPQILQQFDKVILLHNEYVTRQEFDAITSHKNVVYLYPNALYAEVILNDDNTITLVRGHNYPLPEIRNGFDWIHDNSPFEYDHDCANMIFSRITNGVMLNCYPENEITQNPELLKAVKEF